MKRRGRIDGWYGALATGCALGFAFGVIASNVASTAYSDRFTSAEVADRPEPTDPWVAGILPPPGFGEADVVLVDGTKHYLVQNCEGGPLAVARLPAKWRELVSPPDPPTADPCPPDGCPPGCCPTLKADDQSLYKIQWYADGKPVPPPPEVEGLPSPPLLPADAMDCFEEPD